MDGGLPGPYQIPCYEIWYQFKDQTIDVDVDKCTMYPPNTTFPWFELVQNPIFEGYNHQISSKYLLIDSFFKITPPLFYLFLAIGLVSQLKKARDGRRILMRKEEEHEMVNVNRLVICMTIAYFLAETPVAVSNFLMSFLIDYRYMTENRDLRRVMGAGIAITRGAAGALSFCMALILLTVCRNIITLLRETVISQYIPFDSAIAFHKEVLSNFDKFQAHHNRRYRNHAERTKRLGHFAKNHQRIKELNEEARKGGRNVTFGWNRFADMPKEERHARFSKIHPRNHSDLPIYKPRHPRQHRAKREIPGSFDLREVYINGSPIIGPVKDQGELINQNPLRGGLNWNLIICH
uniref:Inhibitor_I29 domain-containing protein n=1 Tax=Caenorhabditis tropicalis TaxID=1561998 RepID=A0A1I7U433_9PELO